MGTRRQFSREFKLEAVKLVTERSSPPAALRTLASLTRSAAMGRSERSNRSVCAGNSAAEGTPLKLGNYCGVMLLSSKLTSDVCRVTLVFEKIERRWARAVFLRMLS